VTSVTRPAEDIVRAAPHADGPASHLMPGSSCSCTVGTARRLARHPSRRWHRPGRQLRLSYARGARNTNPVRRLTPGLPATVTALTACSTSPRWPAQVWIAGGIGVVPFLSWLQASHQRIGTAWSSLHRPNRSRCRVPPELLARAIACHPCACTCLTRTHGHLTGATSTPRSKPRSPTCTRLSAARAHGRGHQPLPATAWRARDYIHAEHFAFR